MRLMACRSCDVLAPCTALQQGEHSVNPASQCRRTHTTCALLLPSMHFIVTTSNQTCCCDCACSTDFWGRRWNRPQAQLLRTLVFEPIKEGRLVKAVQHHTTGSTPSRCAAEDSGAVLAGSTAMQASSTGTGTADGHSPGTALLQASDAVHNQDGMGIKQAGSAVHRTSAEHMQDGTGAAAHGSGAYSSSSSRTRVVVATLATFLFSGLEHVLFYWCVLSSAAGCSGWL